MFEQTFVPSGKTNRPWTVLGALLGEVLMVVVAMLVPLMHLQALPMPELTSFLIAPPPPPPPPPAPAVVVHQPVRVRARLFNPGQLIAPRIIPKQIAMINDKGLSPPPAVTGVVGGVPGGIPGGVAGGVIGGILGGIPAAAPPPPPPIRQAPKPKVPAQVRVGGNVEAARLIHRVVPAYPILARDAQVQGVVRLTATIGKDGNVESLRVLSGHALLIPAAIRAVRQWRYKPTLLNGDPVEVITEIDVHFTLS